MIFSALYGNTYFFDFWQDQSAVISRFKFPKFLIDYKMGLIFHDFSTLYGNTHIFSIFGKIKVPLSRDLNYQNNLIDYKMGFTFHDFFSTQRQLTDFFYS